MSISKRAKAQYDKQHRAARRAWLSKIKDVSCADCGHRFPPAAMSFEHINRRTKLFNVSAKITMSLDRLEREIKKCIVVCMNCHMVRTYGKE
jgi:hypothetical protein